MIIITTIITFMEPVVEVVKVVIANSLAAVVLESSFGYILMIFQLSDRKRKKGMSFHKKHVRRLAKRTRFPRFDVFEINPRVILSEQISEEAKQSFSSQSLLSRVTDSQRSLMQS